MTNFWDVTRTLLLVGMVIYLWVEVRPMCQQLVKWKTSVQSPGESAVLPKDLELQTQSFDTEWAREDARKVLLELYQEHQDWDLVRAAYGARV